MIFSQMKKTVVVAQDTFTATSNTAAGYVDTRGWDYAECEVYMGAATAATQNPSVLSITEGDTTSSFAAIAALTGDATDGFTIPNSVTALTDTCSTVRLGIDLKGKRKRYLKLNVTGGIQAITGVFHLYRASECPDTDAEAGCAEIVNV